MKFLPQSGIWIPTLFGLRERLAFLWKRLRGKTGGTVTAPWVRAFVCPNCAALRSAEIKGLNINMSVCPYCGFAGKTRLTAVRVRGRLSLTAGLFHAKDYEDIAEPGLFRSVFGRGLSAGAPSPSASSAGDAEEEYDGEPQ